MLCSVLMMMMMMIDCNLKATLSSGYKLTKYSIIIIVLNKLAGVVDNVVGLKSVFIVICKRINFLRICPRNLPFNPNKSNYLSFSLSEALVSQLFNPFTPKIWLVLLTVCHRIFWYYSGEFSIGSTYSPSSYILLYSHHFSTWYCTDIVRRSFLFVPHESLRVSYLLTKSWMNVSTNLPKLPFLATACLGMLTL